MHMKHIAFILFLLLSSISFAQNLNQFDGNGKRHGLWKKNFDDTNVIRYEGEFKHGKEVGLFKFYMNIKNEAVLSATKNFDNKEDLAEVTFYTSKGKVISKGEMHGKAYVGKWTYYHKGSKQIMMIENYGDYGQLEGESLVYYDNGQVAEKRNYKNNKLDGKVSYFHENGKEMKIYIYNMGLLHGPAKFYNAKGVLDIEGQYKNDKKDGIWKYYKDGELTEEKDFTVYSKNPYLKKE